MNKYDRITPEGTRDALFAECTLRRQIENRLNGLFTARGYSEIITPTLEFYDVFNRDAQPFPQEHMYKLTDAKGRLMVLRPDNTVPIARVCATRLRGAGLPLRLCYQQNIHVISPSLKGRDDEISQAGIELIGSDSRMADLEVVAAAVDALQACGEEYTLELGNAAFFRTLMQQLNASDEIKDTIRDCIEAKNYPALNDLLDALPESDSVRTLRMLPRLFGGEEVFEKAAALCSGEAFNAILRELRSLWEAVVQFAGADRVKVDLGMMHRTDYYTGMILRGYLSGYGDEILSGCDIVLDGLDNVSSRLLLEDICEELDIPISHGAISGWNIQTGIFLPGQRCMHKLYEGKTSLKPGSNMGFVASICSGLEVAEAVKHLTGKPSLAGRLLVWNLSDEESFIMDI